VKSPQTRQTSFHCLLTEKCWRSRVIAKARADHRTQPGFWINS